jgi:hypothetical protein
MTSSVPRVQPTMRPGEIPRQPKKTRAAQSFPEPPAAETSRSSANENMFELQDGEHEIYLTTSIIKPGKLQAFKLPITRKKTDH